MTHAGSSYVALRTVPSAGADAWWAAVRGRNDTPPAITALLNGRTRIELSPAEADATLNWAATLAGWAAASPKPLVQYPREFCTCP